MGAPLGVMTYHPAFGGAEASVASFAHGIRYRRDLVAGVRVLAIDPGLGATGDSEGIAGLLSAGQVIGDQLRCVRCGSARVGIASKRGETARIACGVG